MGKEGRTEMWQGARGQKEMRSGGREREKREREEIRTGREEKRVGKRRRAGGGEESKDWRSWGGGKEQKR